MIILANDGMGTRAKAALESLGFLVDVKKYEGEELIKRMREVDAMTVRSATMVRKELLDAVKDSRLKLIIRAGVGMDNVDATYAKEVGIVAVNTPEASSDSVAELAIAHMFALSRHLHRSNTSMRTHQWLKNEYMGTEIAGKTLGIIGLGRIGRALAKKALALGMNILYTDTRRDCYVGEMVVGCVSFDELLAESDYLSIHTPQLNGRPLIAKEEIEKMKDGAFLINLARGGLVDEEALLDALDAGKLAGAGLDVFAEEPLKNERLLSHERVSMTPHIGASTVEAQERIGENIVAIVRDFFHV